MSDFGVDLLAFAPHPDDAEIFCGGVLLRSADLGRSTAVVDLSRGERASHGSVEERAREAGRASAILGLAFRDNLGLPDARLDARDAAQVDAVVDALRRRRPEIVLLPWREERHPDHVAACALVLRALFLAGLRKHEASTPGERFAPRQALHYAMRHRMTPSFVVDTSAAWERKLQAIRCHASQVGRAAGEDATLVSSSLALGAIEARDRWYGSMIGATHGEPLRAIVTPGLRDVVGHYRDNPYSEAHAFEPLA